MKYLQLIAVSLTIFLVSIANGNTGKKLNVLWIIIDDQSPWHSIYGNDLVKTPNIDSLASRGVLFTRAYSESPVCSPSRSALITGSHAIRLGTHDHRSSRTKENQIFLPENFKTAPEIFRENGYETYNSGKDDYNFFYKKSDLYSIMDKKADNKLAKYGKSGQGSGDWSDIKSQKPFFGQIRVSGGKDVGDQLPDLLAKSGYPAVKASQVTVPPQYPDIHEMRYNIAMHMNTVMQTDIEVGKVLDRLEKDNLTEKTIIFLFSDHGSDLPRSKEFCYSEGLHVPLIISVPESIEGIESGTVRDDLVSLIDVTGTSLVLANQNIPESMDTLNVFDKSYSREYVFSASDRSANVIDRVRSVMGKRYHYIKNYKLDRPLFNYGHREMMAIDYPDSKYGYFAKLRSMYEDGLLNEIQATPFGDRTAEELYDLQSDPNETVNLASDKNHTEELIVMRAALDGWIEETGDKGAIKRSSKSLVEVVERIPPHWLKSPEFRDFFDEIQPAT
tara:strand:+ start:1058 stop:2563 length:1506 start_codon:yes stop_codon:yes gene_type:complete